MAPVKIIVEPGHDQINHIKMDTNAKSEKDFVNAVPREFDTDFQLSQEILKNAGNFYFKEVD
jgi:hypothetical protein